MPVQGVRLWLGVVTVKAQAASMASRLHPPKP
jgi:hypothetical protein